MVTLVVLHGWNSRPQKWYRVKNLLEKGGLEVEVPALPGFSWPLSREWNLTDYVDWLLEWLEEKKLRKVILLGHSFGGRIAIKFAYQHPRRLKGLVLVDAAGIRDKTLLANLRRLVALLLARAGKLVFPSGKANNFLRQLFYKLLRENDYFAAEGALRGTMSQVVAEDLEPLLTGIKIATLVVWGNRDKITPLWMGKLVKRKIRRSQLEIIRGGGHSCYLTDPDVLAKAVGDWVKGREIS